MTTNSAINLSATAELPPLNHPWNKCITVGRGYELLRADLREHLLVLQKEFGYKHIRFHATFHDDVAVVHRGSDNSLVYRWTQLDKIYDFLVDAGFAPIMEINPMPAALASGDQTMCWYKANVTPPKSYAQWEHFLRAFLIHFAERYGIARLRNWYFEVWNEPNLRNIFWSGSQQEYFQLYASCAKVIKELDTELRVGGPAGAGDGWNLDLARYCRENSVPLDFISYHVYPVFETECKETLDANISTALPAGMNMVAHLKTAKKNLAAEGFGDLPIFITEWNTQSQDQEKQIKWSGNESVSTLFAGAAVCHFATASDEDVDIFGWWVASDVFEEGGPQVEPYGRGFQYYGMLTVDGVPKSSYHAFSFLNRMRGPRYDVAVDNQVSPLQNLLVTDERVATRCLIWNCVFPFEDERTWEGTLELPVPAIMASEHQLRVVIHKVAKGWGSAYEFWQEMGSPANLTRAEQEALAARSLPAVSAAMHKVVHGKIALDFKLLPNEFAFIEIGGAPAGNVAISTKDQDELNVQLML